MKKKTELLSLYGVFLQEIHNADHKRHCEKSRFRETPKSHEPEAIRFCMWGLYGNALSGNREELITKTTARGRYKRAQNT